MAQTTHITMARAQAALDTLLTGLNAGTIKLYTGTIPATPETAVSSQTLLATLTLNATAFGAAANNTTTARATANAITPDTSADATGTATWFRVASSGGTAFIDGNIGTSDEAMVLNTTAIVSGAEVDITSYTFTVPES